MIKRRFRISLGIFLLMLMSIGLTISTLHSHHNLEFHNSPDYTDTGQCLNIDTTLCPICGYIVEASQAPVIDSHAFLNSKTIVKNRDTSDIPKRIYIPILGRSPPTA